MASGISAQKSTLEIATGSGGAKTITAITVGYPAIVTSAAHGFTNGTVITLASITGTMSSLNGQKVVVSNVTANTFALYNVDTTGLAYTSGGTATPQAYTKINGVTSFDGFDGQADDMDATDLDSDAKEFISGLRDEGKFGFEAKRLRADAGQIALRANLVSGAVVGMKLTLSDGTVVSFSVLVKTMPIGGAVGSILKGKIDCKISGAVAVV
jgi:hypothetical protein